MISVGKTGIITPNPIALINIVANTKRMAGGIGGRAGALAMGVKVDLRAH
jgi:hypothetical protein